ncbi:hypothetical protein DL98DRAFT_32642 [Cadophora sp. DSE1049]|nr:hypothetical protein DL98DRAFT_32642 [Cadophora sp. DSE1049]
MDGCTDNETYVQDRIGAKMGTVRRYLALHTVGTIPMELCRWAGSSRRNLERLHCGPLFLEDRVFKVPESCWFANKAQLPTTYNLCFVCSCLGQQPIQPLPIPKTNSDILVTIEPLSFLHLSDILRVVLLACFFGQPVSPSAQPRNFLLQEQTGEANRAS